MKVRRKLVHGAGREERRKRLSSLVRAFEQLEISQAVGQEVIDQARAEARIANFV